MSHDPNELEDDDDHFNGDDEHPDLPTIYEDLTDDDEDED